MSSFGPSRSDLRFRLAFSAAGLALLAAAIARRGLPATPGGWEAIAFAGLFFGGTFLWTLRKLLRRDFADRD